MLFAYSARNEMSWVSKINVSHIAYPKKLNMFWWSMVLLVYTALCYGIVMLLNTSVILLKNKSFIEFLQNGKY
jgi:uncharacterized membrane protein